MNANVLILCDEIEVTSWLEEFLLFNGYAATTHPVANRQADLPSGKFDLVIVDAADPNSPECVKTCRQAEQTKGAWVLALARVDEVSKSATLVKADAISGPPCTLRRVLHAIRTLLHRTPLPPWLENVRPPQKPTRYKAG